MCRTRWLQRIDATDIFMRLYLSVVECLENICNDGARLWSQDSLTDARGLLLAITTTDLVSALVITNSCLKYLKALIASLQAEAKDIVTAVSEIDTVTATVQDVQDIDTHHAQWFLTITEMLSEVDIEPSVPRRCGRQTQWSNVPADTPSEYFQRTISIPVFDHLLCELRSQFGKHQRRALLCFSIVPSLFVSLESDDHISRFKALSDLYENDLPPPECLESELHSWQIKWRRELEDHGESSLPTGLTHTLRHISSMYPNITALIKILYTLPVTTCTAEKSFCSLKEQDSI